ncbi:MAG: hypothetical protein ACTSRZ_07005 [Promethearchaeota archaeon]
MVPAHNYNQGNVDESKNFGEEIVEIDKDFVQSEDIIFLIEITKEYFQPDDLFIRELKKAEGPIAQKKNMQDTDMSIARGYNILKKFNEIMQDRMKIDPNDRYNIIFYNQEFVVQAVKNEFDLTNDPFDLLGKFSEITPAYKPGIPKLVEAISLASQIHLATFRRVGGKTLRIIIITNTGTTNESEKLKYITIKILKKLGVIVDIFKFGRGIIDPALELLAKETGGKIYLVDSAKKFHDYFNEIKMKKMVLLKKYLSDYKYTQNQILGKEPLINPFLEKIASNLENIPKNYPKHELKSLKCLICFKNKCIHNQNDHLKLCPNCKKPLHNCCASQWSILMKLNNPYVFRCPSCFFLLKIPHDIVDQQKLNSIIAKRKQEIEQIRKKQFEKQRKEEELKKELIGFHDKNKQKEAPSPIEIFADWIDSIPELYPHERMQFIQEFSKLTSNKQRNEYIEMLIYKKNWNKSKMNPPFFK